MFGVREARASVLRKHLIFRLRGTLNRVLSRAARFPPSLVLFEQAGAVSAETVVRHLLNCVSSIVAVAGEFCAAACRSAVGAGWVLIGRSEF